MLIPDGLTSRFCFPLDSEKPLTHRESNGGDIKPGRRREYLRYMFKPSFFAIAVKKLLLMT